MVVQENKHVIYVIYKDNRPYEMSYLQAAYYTEAGAKRAIGNAVRREIKETPFRSPYRMNALKDLQSRFSIVQVVV